MLQPKIRLISLCDVISICVTSRCYTVMFFSAVSLRTTFAIAICFSEKFSLLLQLNFSASMLDNYIYLSLNIFYAVSIGAAIAIHALAENSGLFILLMR